MRDRIEVEQLQIGMYVVLPAPWLKHPFLKNEFVINSTDQIEKIIDAGFDEVVIDTARGMPVANDSPRCAEPEEEREEDKNIQFVPPRVWEPEKLVPPLLKEAIRDRALSPEKKSKIVYQCSLELMGKLLEDPKTENIREAKKGISDIVDLIISDDATSRELLRITSYDFYTYTHSVNVGVLAVMLSKSLYRSSNAHDMHELGAGFFLHDIGKVRVDPSIINKRGSLDRSEMEKIRLHPTQGYQLLSEAKQISEECRIIVMQHHERANGSGYPHRLRGRDIHPYGRICCIADVYDALTSERSYKQRLSTFDALKYMKEQMLSHFENDMFERFVRLFSSRK